MPGSHPATQVSSRQSCRKAPVIQTCQKSRSPRNQGHRTTGSRRPVPFHTCPRRSLGSPDPQLVAPAQPPPPGEACPRPLGARHPFLYLSPAPGSASPLPLPVPRHERSLRHCTHRSEFWLHMEASVFPARRLSPCPHPLARGHCKPGLGRAREEGALLGPTRHSRGSGSFLPCKPPRRTLLLTRQCQLVAKS